MVDMATRGFSFLLLLGMVSLQELEVSGFVLYMFLYLLLSGLSSVTPLLYFLLHCL